MNRLILVRHGENTANLTLEFSHRSVDYSLTGKGVLQAQQTAEFLCDTGIQEVFSSPLKRAVETAEVIARPLGLPITVIEGFREVNVGILEGQKPTAALWAQHDAIIAAWADGHPETCFPGGEDLFTLTARARSAFEQALAGKDGRKILIVAHGGIIYFTLHSVFAGIDRNKFHGAMPNCSITELDTWNENGRLHANLLQFASAEHLSGEAARLALGLPQRDPPQDPDERA